MEKGVQLVRVSVKGGYSPNVIEVRAGVPVRMLFDRQEAGDCSSRVVMPDFKVNELLPAYATTAVEFVPSEVGDFRFACGMNMISGTVHVVGADSEAAQMRGAATNGTAVALLERGGREGYGGGGDVLHIDHSPGQHSDNHGAGVSEEANGRGAAVAPEAGAADAGDAEAAERGAEIGDLTRRVIVGAVLTAPVLFAVMAHEFFGVDVGAGAADEPLAAAGADRAGDVLHRVADPPHRLAHAVPPHRGHEHADHPRHGRRLRLQPGGHRRPGRPAGERARGVLRGGRGHHHPDPARPAAGGPGQGRHRRGDPRR